MTHETATRTRFRVGGMDCAACGAKVQNAVSRLDGVEDVEVSVGAGTMNVTHRGPAPVAAISHAVKWLGYTVSLANQPAKVPNADPELHQEDHFELGSGPWWRTRKAMLTAACGLGLALAYVVAQFFPDMALWAFLVAMAIGLIPIARRAITAALSGSPFTIETLMSIAAIGAVFIGATEEAATVVLLFLVGEMLEGVAAGQARASIQGLADLVPKSALLEQGGETTEVPAASLPVGAIILIRPGDRIAADGEITEGNSSIDEAPVTGESVPKLKGPGDTVFAGTINTDAVLRVRVTATSSDNTISRIVKLVEEAQESKAPTERFIDQFSRIYTPAVLVVGALVAVVPPLMLGGDWAEWVYKGLAVLLIGCPCALVISTPAAVAAGLSAGARRGLLLKGGAVLEGLRKVTVVALDKTGTLTEGKPVVTDIKAFGRTDRDVLSMAGALETGSSHPLALAVLARAKAEKAPVPPAGTAKAIPGKGVSGNVGGKAVLLLSPQAAGESLVLSPEQQELITAFNDEGKSVSVLLVAGQLGGILAIRDEARADAQAGLRALEAAGIRTVMLTGDNARAAAAIGRGLGIEVRAGLLPEDKQVAVRELQASGEVVAKVGDGINDAPALAAADFGIAMGGGTDVALETADAAILHGRVVDVANMIILSKKVMGNIGQNIAISLGLKAVFLVTTIVGITGLWPAILADTGATVIVTLNALRLLGVRFPSSAA